MAEKYPYFYILSMWFCMYIPHAVGQRNSKVVCVNTVHIGMCIPCAIYSLPQHTVSTYKSTWSIR